MGDKIMFWCFTHSHPPNYEFYANFIIVAIVSFTYVEKTFYIIFNFTIGICLPDMEVPSCPMILKPDFIRLFLHG